MAVMCTRCLDEWDRDDESYGNKKVVPVVIYKGESLCLDHYRAVGIDEAL